MLSSELAELAGVTVRTLRHYHQIGLLPEPPRSIGGYRRYDVSDLVRLLRITRSTALGVPLSALPAVLDDPAAVEELLDELDRQAAAEIERLNARRADIAALRSSGSPPDLPPELSVLRSAPEAGVPEEMARYEHEQLVLIGHLLGEGGPAELAALFEGADREMIERLEPLTARFYVLGPDTPEDEVASLIDDWTTGLAPLSERLAGTPEPDPKASALLDELNEQTLTPVQHRVLRRVLRRLEHEQRPAEP
ncbi:MerR family transcriptional regulator [Nocardiopsis sp. JB363]|uniref:helix-turn-helix domain-containing protein n=1 Tax=Nocardiopsis sp. JB363 TaxID=1434837 RepID=UPI000979EB0B|nr:MerR family transcriptional regulator [Nocardiopsis sp. JB363]SIO84512.1 Transcriptional regulator, MerR family [Nocardiopsis sp. JB363]